MLKFFTNGILKENPVFVQVLGLCPLLAVSTAAMNGIGMGLATTFVLVMSNVFISAMRKVIPDEIRIPSFIIVIASFTTIVGMLLKAYLPEIDKSLGLFIPLIVVNCIVLGRAEGFAYSHNVPASILDGLGNGIGFTLALVVLGAIREILGNGTIFGIALFGANFQPMLLMILPPGAFITLGFIIAAYQYLTTRKKVA